MDRKKIPKIKQRIIALTLALLTAFTALPSQTAYATSVGGSGTVNGNNNSQGGNKNNSNSNSNSVSTSNKTQSNSNASTPSQDTDTTKGYGDADGGNSTSEAPVQSVDDGFEDESNLDLSQFSTDMGEDQGSTGLIQ